MATERIDLLIEARNRASGALQDVNKQLSGLNKAAGVAAGGLGALAAAFAVDKVLDFGQAIYGLAQQAASVGVLRESFQGLAQGVGQSADSMLAALRSASAGMISDQNLMLAANKAMLLGVADTAEEMAGLLEVARTRGAAMGLDVTQAFDNIVTGLGRMSPLILDNLGITLDLDKTMGDYAKSVGKTAASLSDAERKQALVNRVMAESKGLIGGASSEAAEMAGSFARAQASIDNMKVALGDLFGPAMARIAQAIADAAGSVADSLAPPTEMEKWSSNLDILKTQIKSLTETADETGYAIAGTANNVINMLMAFSPQLQGLSENVARAMAVDIWQNWVTGQPEAIRAVGEAWRLLRDYNESGAEVIAQELVGLSAMTERANELQRKLGELFATMQTGLMGGGSIGQVARPYIDDMLAAMEQLRQVRDTMVAEYATSMDQLRASAETMAAAFGQNVLGDLGAAEAFAAQMNLQNALMTTISALEAVGAPAGYVALVMREVAAAAEAAATGESRAGSAAESAGASLGFFGLSAGNAIGPVGALGAAANQAALDFVGLGNSAVDAANKINKALGAVAAASNLNKARNTIAALQGPKPEDWSWPGLQVQLEGVGAKMGALQQHTLYMPRAMSAAGGGVSALNNEFSKLQSTIQSLLQQQLDPGVGVNPDDFLPRPDAINENARRLADIMVNGFKGQDWLSEFAAEVPDIYQALLASGDPKATAAQLLKDFQAGLVPELIDKEAAKARVKEMLLGQENMAALANEIASELAAEMGISLGQAQQAVAQTLGMGAGGAAGTGLIPIDGAQSGAKMVDSLVLAIAERQSEIARSGELAGAQWGTAFLGVVESNVPITLLDILAQLVTPLVLALINAENSRKGAR